MKNKGQFRGLCFCLLFVLVFAGCRQKALEPATEPAPAETSRMSTTAAPVESGTIASKTAQALPETSPASNGSSLASSSAGQTTTLKPAEKSTTATTKKAAQRPIVTLPTHRVPVTTPPKEKEEAYEAEILRLVNKERAAAGLSPLRRSATLASAAMIRTKEIKILFSHTRPNGTDCFTVSDEAYGENLAFGFSTAQKAMAAWMKSEGHRENILRPQFKTLGVGQQNGYWVQLFGY